MYADMLRKMFQGIDLSIEDLYLLDGFQIGYLPDRVPQREFAAVLHANPSINRFLTTKHPPIVAFIEDVFTRFGPAANQQELDEYSEQLLWEIADQFVYIKRPDMYDERVDLGWNFEEVLEIVPLENKQEVECNEKELKLNIGLYLTLGQLWFIAVSEEAVSVFSKCCLLPMKNVLLYNDVGEDS